KRLLGNDDIGHTLGLIRVYDPGEAEGISRALDRRLVPEHAMLHFPWLGRPLAFGEIFRHDDRARAILAIDAAGDRLELALIRVMIVELDPIHRWVRVDEVHPAVD